VGFSKVSDGNMSYKWGYDTIVESSRRIFCNELGIDINKVVGVSLVHGVDIIKPTLNDGGKGMFFKTRDSFLADGLMTDIPGLGLCFVVADCMPVVLFDPINKAVSLLHVGRKGVEQNILAVALSKMTTEYGTRPTEVLMGVGPGISAESYVFDSDEGINKEFWGSDFKLGDDKKFHMDNKNKLKQQALELGIPINNIEISQIDTYTSRNYFSHRFSYVTGAAEGRFAAVVFLKR
jgi:hypothetical protein